MKKSLVKAVLMGILFSSYSCHTALAGELGKATIDNTDFLIIDEDFGEAENGGIVNNTGDLTFNKKSYISTIHSSGIVKNNGEMQIAGGFYFDKGLEGITQVVIENNGILSIEPTPTELSNICGRIIHNEGADTYIRLGGENKKYSCEDALWGTITGSNNGNFKLVLDNGSEWFSHDFEMDADLYKGNLQTEAVSGVELNGGTIAFSLNHWIPVDTYNWYNKYGTLTLNNFNSNGNFGAVAFGGDNLGCEFISGGICLFTDLQNNVGDKVVFTGTTPDATIPIGIYNKNDNGGIPIVREDGHSVTIIEAPSDTKMQFKTSLLTYGNPSQEFLEEIGGYVAQFGADPIDPSNYKVYKPQIDELVDGNTKYWNFVGWEETGASRTDSEVKKEMAAQQSEGTDIIQVDIENTFKRVNELRADIHTDIQSQGNTESNGSEEENTNNSVKAQRRDIRTDPGEVGVWMRGETGETKIGTYSYNYHLMSGGYDWHKENDARILFTGIGFSYGINDCDDAVIGDSKSYGVSLYSSWYGKEKNEYVDLILKYGKLDKEYAGLDRNGVFVSGEYDKDMFSIATKYGRRIYKDDWYWEPSVGFTWGKVGSADFVDNLGTNIHADSTNSMIASLGMQVGKNIKGIEYYCKAEVMHDFDGEVSVSAPGLLAEDDMGGTWLKCAIGASRKVSENNSFYLEVERDFGNKVEKPYGLSLGYRFTW